MNAIAYFKKNEKRKYIYDIYHCFHFIIYPSIESVELPAVCLLTITERRVRGGKLFSWLRLG